VGEGSNGPPGIAGVTGVEKPSSACEEIGKTPIDMAIRRAIPE
jgi:hypothetical protein